MKAKKPAFNLDDLKAPAEKSKPDCVTLLGGMLCGLCMVAEMKDVREAVQWWARNQKGWTHFAVFQAQEKVAEK